MVHLNSCDKTLERNYIKKFKYIIQEYELIKEKRHPRFRFVGELYKHHNTNRQTFAKYYNRYKHSGNVLDLLPKKFNQNLSAN